MTSKYFNTVDDIWLVTKGNNDDIIAYLALSFQLLRVRRVKGDEVGHVVHDFVVVPRGVD